MLNYGVDRMNKRGIIILYTDFSRDWLPLLKVCGINKLGLHALYCNGGVEGIMQWLSKEEVRKDIDFFEENGIEVHVARQIEQPAQFVFLPLCLFGRYRSTGRPVQSVIGCKPYSAYGSLGIAGFCFNLDTA